MYSGVIITIYIEIILETSEEQFFIYQLCTEINVAVHDIDIHSVFNTINNLRFCSFNNESHVTSN